MKVLQSNRNLHVYNSTHFENLLLIQSENEFIYEYLDNLYSLILSASSRYPRLSAFRFDLRYPAEQSQLDMDDSTIIHRFVESLKSQIESNQQSSIRDCKRVHLTDIIYLWVKEYGIDGRPHYHFLLLLNRDAYFSLGNFNSNQNNLSKRIVEAWARALKINFRGEGLVHFSNDYELFSSEDGIEGLDELFYYASYMCKVRTKRFGNSERVFGCSRI